MILKRKVDGETTTEKVTVKEATRICSARNRTKPHLCWDGDCPNALCNSEACPKVFDIEKKPIEEYDFIISGIETYKNSGELTALIVEDCALYNKYFEEHPEEAKVKVKHK